MHRNETGEALPRLVLRAQSGHPQGGLEPPQLTTYFVPLLLADRLQILVPRFGELEDCGEGVLFDHDPPSGQTAGDQR